MKNVFIAMIVLCAALLGLPGPGRTAEDYSGKRLLDASFAGKQLQGARFDGSVLRGAIFDGADLTGASFRKADVRGVSFKGAKGLGSDANAFRDALYSTRTVWPEGFSPPSSAALIESPAAPANAAPPNTAPPNTGPAASAASAAPQAPAAPASAAQTGYAMPPSDVDKKGQDLSNQHFSGHLKGANFDGTILKFTSFTGANLEGASFRGAQTYWTRFNGANLRGADFSGAQLDGPFFIGANLTDANLENQILRLGGWRGYFEAPKLNPDLNYGYDLKAQMMAGDSDRGHNAGLILKGANLKRTVIFGNLETVDFRKADLRGADLSETEKAEPRFFKDAVYDSGTVWPKGFDPAGAGTVRGDELPRPATRSVAGATAAPAKPEGHGISGFAWGITSPGENQGRRIYIYPDGAYSWTRRDGEIERQWKTAAGAKAIILQQGLADEDWTATLASPEKITLRSGRSGSTLEAERGASAE